MKRGKPETPDMESCTSMAESEMSSEIWLQMLVIMNDIQLPLLRSRCFSSISIYSILYGKVSTKAAMFH